MKTLILVLALVVSNLADEVNDRGTNAAQVATAGLNAARNSQQLGFNSVPYLTAASYMSQSFGVIGGVLRYYHDVKSGVLPIPLKHSFSATGVQGCLDPTQHAV